MSEEIPDTTENVTVAPPPPKRSRKWKWIFIVAGALVGLPVVVFAIWSVIALNWSYSDGFRAGYVQKFSKKGWVCKTWEGELSMVNLAGQAQERWTFTVRDDSIAQVLQGVMGKRVTLHYEEHPGVPTSCFGDTRYYVVGVRTEPGP